MSTAEDLAPGPFAPVVTTTRHIQAYQGAFVRIRNTVRLYPVFLELVFWHPKVRFKLDFAGHFEMNFPVFRKLAWPDPLGEIACFNAARLEIACFNAARLMLDK